jgi:hypothetical protein
MSVPSWGRPSSAITWLLACVGMAASAVFPLLVVVDRSTIWTFLLGWPLGKGNTDCRYGRPASGWALAVTILGVVWIALTLVLIFGVWYSLLRSAVGVPRYYAWLHRREVRRRPTLPVPGRPTNRSDPG